MAQISAPTMQRKSRTELDEYRRRFEQHYFQVVQRRYGMQLSDQQALLFISMFKGFVASEKRHFWDELASEMGEDRTRLYKYYNNTYVPSIMPKFPTNLLADFSAMATEVTVSILRVQKDIGREALITLAMERAKEALNFQEYDNIYHPDTGYHKIRNTIISVHKQWHDNSTSRLKLGIDRQECPNELFDNICKRLLKQESEQSRLSFPIFPNLEEDRDSNTDTFADSFNSFEYGVQAGAADDECVWQLNVQESCH